ncbi:MAG: hypothetical protein PW788_15725 [Micavibrio sp.]|nr:hypothetical protein [Micavibrio sp.]
MALKLKSAVKKVFGNNEEIDRILALPMTQLRLELKQAFQDRSFTEENFNDFVERLSKVDDITKQIPIAKKAAVDREVASELDIELNSPAKQLLWGATLTRMMSAGKEPVARSRLWDQLQGTVGMHNEAISVSKIIAGSLQNDDTTFDWGQPGSWFYFDPHKNHINLDLYFMMLVGFEHIRAVHLHEIGHSELSVGFSGRMKELYEQVKHVIDPRTVDSDKDADGKSKKPKRQMKRSDQKEIALAVAEWQLRFKLWHMTEDNAVHQFAANMSKMMPQDFADSLNYIGVILQGYGELARGDDKTRDVKITTDMPVPKNAIEKDFFERMKKQQQEDANRQRDEAVRIRSTPLTDDQIKDIKAGNISPEIAARMFDEIKSTVFLAFFEKNGLFEARDKSWERFRVIPDDIRKAVDVSNVPGANGRDAFRYLVDLSIGMRGASADMMDLPVDPKRAGIYLEQRATLGGLSNVFSASAKPTAKDEALKILSGKDVLGAAASGVDEPVQTLIEQAAHARGIRNLQPKPSDRMLVHDPYATLKDSYRATVDSTSAERGRLMEHIWDVFLKPYADVLLKKKEEDFDKKMDQKQKQQQQQKNQQQQNQQNQQGQKGEQGEQQKGEQGDQQQSGGGEGESGEGGGESEGDDNDGDGQEQDGQQGGKKGQKSKQKSGGGDEQDDDQQGGGGGDPEMDLDDDLENDIGDMAENPGEKRDKENGTGEGQGQGKDKDGDKNEKSKSGGKGQDGEDKPENGEDGDGEGEGGEKGDKNDQDGPESEGKGGPGWDQDPNQKPKDPKKVGDMKNKNVVDEDLTEDQKEQMKQNAKNMADAKQGDLESNNAGNQSGLDLGKLAKGDWRDFNLRVQELSPVINRVAESFKKIRQEQRRTILQQAKTHEFMAEDGDVQSRLDKDKLLETKFKQASKQKMNIDDFKKMQEDKTATAESTIEMFIMIDGSGSMPSFQLGNGTTAMEVALQTAVINYMACRKAGIDAYILMWGDAEPRIIATPDTPLKVVGERLESFRKGINSGTDLAPAVVSSVETMSKHVNKNGTVSGSSHMLVLSDGDIGDYAKSVEKLSIFGKFAKNMSLDVAVLRPSGNNSETQMERAIKTVMNNSGNRIVGLLRGNDAQKVPLDLAHMMLRRVRAIRVKSEPDKEKRRRLKILHKKLKD